MQQFEPQYLKDQERQRRYPFYVHPMDAIAPPAASLPAKARAPAGRGRPVPDAPGMPGGPGPAGCAVLRPHRAAP